MARFFARFFILFFLLISGPGLADEWFSPIESLYREKNPELFSRYEEVKELNDTWRGQREYLTEAQQKLTSIIEADDRFAPAYHELGRTAIMAGYINNTKFREGSLEAAEAAILMAIEIEPDYADAYVLLGHLYTRAGDNEAAKSSLEKAESIGTGSPWLNLNWGELLFKLGENEPAYHRYMEVVTEGTDNRKAYADALNGVTKYYEKEKEYELANEWYQKKLEYEPDSAWNWGNYASFLLYSMGDEDAAIANAEIALSIRDYGMGSKTLACALYTKWARQLDEGNAGPETSALFSRAYSLYRDIDRAAATMNHYETTRFAAERLMANMAAIREQKKRQKQEQQQ